MSMCLCGKGRTQLVQTAWTPLPFLEAMAESEQQLPSWLEPAVSRGAFS